MFETRFCLALLILTVASPLQAESDHAKNSLFQTVLKEGLTAEGRAIKLQEPAFRDGMTPEAQMEALKAIAGSERAAREMLNDSVTAPHKLAIRDERGAKEIVRSLDVTFIIHAKLDNLEVDQGLLKGRVEPVEVGNMRFEVEILPPAGSDSKDVVQTSIRSKSRLLDRIEVEQVDRLMGTRSDESVVVASRTDLRTGAEGKPGSFWNAIQRKGRTESKGPAQPYQGSAGYVKFTRWKGSDGVILVEGHFAYAEPIAWFDGAPILRSKFGLVAQDQIRRLRRELKNAAGSNR